MINVPIWAQDVETAVQEIVPYLEDTSTEAIYFDGWHGLGASAVLRAIAEHPPPSLLEKFDRIIHIDCSRWKSRRALQRVIVDELKLTQQVAADFERQDKEDDFNVVDQGSRAEIRSVAKVIARFLADYRCLVVFHSGSDDGMVDLISCGVLPHEHFHTKVLWTVGGRLNLNKDIRDKVMDGEDVNSLHCFLYPVYSAQCIELLLEEEAREIALYTHKLGVGVTPEIATECCLYLLSLNQRGGDVIDYNWATHASSYWVCDGIVQGGEDNQAWELARAVQQQIRLEDYSSNKEPAYFGSNLDISKKHWICIANSKFKEVPQGTTSLFFAPPLESGYVSFPKDRFHEADQLRVLKLCRCTFSFSSPPFHCCRNLRFLGLDRCTDEQQLGEEEEKTGRQAVETFQRLWVLDVSHTDWELDFPAETEEPVMATDIREVHINKARIWHSNFVWRRLPNLRKLRVVEPTSSWWETGRQDEFMDMVKLELLDLSGNNTMQVLPSLSGATNLKTLVLDGCAGLEHVGPEGLPPSLESFWLDTGAKISRINLAGCARLVDFRLSGSLPNLVELDLSYTAVKMIDLTDDGAVRRLQKVFLVGCEQLHLISWPPTRSEMHQLRLLCIDTRAGGEVARKASSYDYLRVCQGEGEEYNQAFVGIADMRLLRFLVRFIPELEVLWIRTKFKLNICCSSTIKDDGRPHRSTGQLAAGWPLPKSLTYHDVSTGQQVTEQIDGSSSSTMSFQPLDHHMEIGEGISDFTNAVSLPGRSAIKSVMNYLVESLHVHDSSSITTVIPEYIMEPQAPYFGMMNELRWCRVERCPKVGIVFDTKRDGSSFCGLETFWGAHLLMARSIWSRARRPRWPGKSFTQLRVIHLYFCPRLSYVLALFSNYDLSNQLETLHILCCGNLRQVFPVEQEFQEIIATSHEKGMLAFPKLKDLYLHDLCSLQHICEAKMFAPNLKTIYIRGCWGLRLLPATDSRRRQDGRPVAVDCEKDWWDKLEWDGMEFGHHPSLFEPCHSKYYKKRHLRSTVLR